MSSASRHMAGIGFIKDGWFDLAAL
uniref:Uncharacterized protein n=1 Tax=Ralstonia solanacearum TaxID=305 RepID=A0A0S4UKY8_RALSL|nr:protein of unknown function [Ralstonia solanacearum]CUV35062.1 protein of unknown function [Ralstonia solanacearum]CUV38504.1 protein of unknown function [Ralstonia solanacearum]CUV43195.1 protein of unknown function [Ralstonia solanacearum]CUV59141.1 protein of unknown function [Ralstonia solanacearum]